MSITESPLPAYPDRSVSRYNLRPVTFRQKWNPALFLLLRMQTESNGRDVLDSPPRPATLDKEATV